MLPKLACFVVLSAVGALFLYSSVAPHYRTVEISPGVFQEQGMTSTEYWSSLITGSVLLTLSIIPLWRLLGSRQRASSP